LFFERSEMNDTGQRDDRVFYRDRKKAYPIIERGEGIYLFDRTGKRYIDASGGPLAVNIGHGVKEVVEAMAKQGEKISFPYSGHFATEPQMELAQEVIDFAPPGMSRVYFVSGGSEAIEIALKLARQYHLGRGEPSRFKIVSRWQSYHGSTIGCLSLAGHTYYRKDYTPYLTHSPHIPAPYCYRCPLDMTYPDCRIACAHALERTIKEEGKETVAGFISEPVTGSSLGALAPPPEYFPIIREICDRYGILLIVDEVITGFGRTGKNFGMDHWETIPDLIVTGKGISSGYAPLGAVAIHEKVVEVFRSSNRSSFFTGYTYSGHPVACAAGLAVLRYIMKNDLVTRCAKMGSYLFGHSERLKALPIVGDIRGKGLLLGIEIVRSKEKKTPFERSQRIAESIVRQARDRGLVIVPGHGLEDGVVGDLLMLAPPFIITEAEIDTVLDLLEEVILEAHESMTTPS